MTRLALMTITWLVTCVVLIGSSHHGRVDVVLFAAMWAVESLVLIVIAAVPRR